MLNICQAIAREEGVNVPGSIPNRLNNPGDIEDGKFAQAHGALPNQGQRFAHFPDLNTGYACMRALLQCPGYKGLTIHQALNKWAPPVENNTSSYEANVCAWTGLTPETVIDAHLG